MEYILMLCLMGAGHSYSCQALQLYSYSTLESCQKAANVFLNDARTLDFRKAVCIPVEAPSDKQ